MSATVNVPTYPLSKLRKMRVSKGDLFKDHEGQFDSSLPQEWLKRFSKWCDFKYAEEFATNSQAVHLSYMVILTTTVWDYTTNRTGMPLSACREVAEALRRYAGNQ